MTVLRRNPRFPQLIMEPSPIRSTDEERLKELDRDPILRPTGQEIFDSLSKAEQDEMLGPAAAEKVRQGEAILSDFVEHDGNFIRQKPVEDLPGGKAWREEDHPRGGDPKNPGRFSRTTGGDKPKLPKWKRDRRYNGWVRSLSPEEQEALARQFYEKLWKELQAYFGTFGVPPPNLIFTDNIPAGFRACVFRDESGIRQVQMRPSTILRLALRGPRQNVTLTVVHEWRHIFQNAGLFHIGRDRPHNDQPIEQDAGAFTRQVFDLINRNRRRRRRKRKPIRPAPYNPENIAENIGKDPTTIPYP